MTERHQPVQRPRPSIVAAKSIFPNFNVTAPLPRGTAAPPQVVNTTPPAPASSGPAGSPKPPGHNETQ